jgi:hypothetical protein
MLIVLDGHTERARVIHPLAYTAIGTPLGDAGAPLLHANHRKTTSQQTREENGLGWPAR